MSCAACEGTLRTGGPPQKLTLGLVISSGTPLGTRMGPRQRPAEAGHVNPAWARDPSLTSPRPKGAPSLHVCTPPFTWGLPTSGGKTATLGR